MPVEQNIKEFFIEFYKGYRLEFKRLESGYMRIQGMGPEEWAQLPEWPCNDDKIIRVGCGCGASEKFIKIITERSKFEFDKWKPKGVGVSGCQLNTN